MRPHLHPWPGVSLVKRRLGLGLPGQKITEVVEFAHGRSTLSRSGSVGSSGALRALSGPNPQPGGDDDQRAPEGDEDPVAEVVGLVVPAEVKSGRSNIR